jgi:hypothetical protein
MMKNIKNKYARIHAPLVPGVYPLDRDFVVYVRSSKHGSYGKICADRKFKTKEGAQIYFDGLQPEQRI